MTDQDRASEISTARLALQRAIDEAHRTGLRISVSVHDCREIGQLNACPILDVSVVRPIQSRPVKDG